MESSLFVTSVGHDIAPQDPLERLQKYRNDRSLRLRSFQKYPTNAIVPKDKLIDNGFYYIGNGENDRVQCVHCGGIVSEWEPDDDVKTVHKKFFPKCPYVQKNNAPNFSYYNDEGGDLEIDGSHVQTNCNDDDGDLETDGVQIPKSTMDFKQDKLDMKYPELKHKMARLKTFKDWPKDAEIKDINTLAEIGLFFTGSGDQCVCFACGNMLEEWEEGDDPKKEHDKYFDDCPLVKLKV
ncbi:hypothetical protein FSP39_008809 [Pinctada imbricata]|uniref:Uncharacterized protein n=1 Tax=Pinctada imbricata TaxID=66713 RepID=A0AA88Y3X3_PINIB|nr:hypothetical protein FSP39_008809 [Pinctada imbricata]